jgi:hypothetical protein
MHCCARDPANYGKHETCDRDKKLLRSAVSTGMHAPGFRIFVESWWIFPPALESSCTGCMFLLFEGLWI